MVRRQIDIRSGVVDCYKVKVGPNSAPNLRPEIQTGSGAPAHSAPKGTLYIRTDATGTTSRLYINTDGSTTWSYYSSAA